MGREGQRLHLRGRHQGLNPGTHLPFPRLGGHPSSPISWVVRATVCTQGEATLHLPFHGQGRPRMHPRQKHRGLSPWSHLPFIGLGDQPSSPVSWAGRVVLCTQGEAPHIEPNTSTTISLPGRPPYISHFPAWEASGIKPKTSCHIFRDYPSSPISWARRAVICTQGEAPCVCVCVPFSFS